ncbi:MAG: hypothetical protein MI685_02470 [Chlorobiales bacterium]|nr:hypothetical protein [Chlorobiales bacterium]
MKKDELKSDFLSELTDKYNTSRKHGAFYLYVKNKEDLSNPGDFRMIIGISDEHLSDVAKESLNILENKDDINDFWIDLKWKVSAYLTVQDLFGAPDFDLNDTSTIFKQWYYYYEAKYILIEAFLCGLNGFTSSVGMLLRLFLEFSLLQNYLYLKIKENRDHNSSKDFFKITHNPKWAKIINGCLPNDEFSKPIQKKLDMHLKTLSNTSTHPYKSVHSPKHSGSFLPEQTLERLFFGYRISIILESVLWLYYVNFPMAFHPVDIQKKFGFNFPVGRFLDENGGMIIKKSIPKKDYNLFYKYSKKSSVIDDLMHFYNSQDDMNDAEIKSTWNAQDGEWIDSVAGHCAIMAKMRVLHEYLSLGERANDIDDYDLSKLSLDKWRKIYKKI